MKVEQDGDGVEREINLITLSSLHVRDYPKSDPVPDFKVFSPNLLVGLKAGSMRRLKLQKKERDNAFV